MFKKHKILNFIVVFFCCAIMLALCTSFVLAATAKLTWTAPTTNSDGSNLTDLAGYKVYWGSASGNYTSNSGSNLVAGTAYTVSSIPDTGTTHFAVTALDTSGNESAKSSDVYKLPGDVNKDGSVNILDFQALVNNYGNTTCGNAADIDLNCNVNILDFQALIKNYGATKT